MTPTFLYISVLFLVTPFAFVAGHVALWDDSMFGRCGNNNQCVNTEQPIDPLQDLTFDEWWWHGYLDFPPVNDSVMSLPAGKSVTVQLAGNVAFTKLGQNPGAEWPGGALPGSKNESIVSDTYWNDFDAGNLHTTGKADVAGCALAIAYTDNANVVRPEDMVVFSVQQECVWHRDTVFDVPANMPPCPNGKCMCSWFWIHNSNGGSDQNYQTAFQCNITYSPGQQISQTPVGKPVPPVNCTGETDKCIKGPKMPMYWKNSECNNMPNPGHFAPTYGNDYGYFQGAQNDIFETINESNWTCPQSKAAGVFATQGPVKVQTPSSTSSNQTAPPESVPNSSSRAPVSSSTTSLTKPSSTPVSSSAISKPSSTPVSSSAISKPSSTPVSSSAISKPSSTPVALPPTQVSSSQTHQSVPTNGPKPSSVPSSQSTHSSIRSSSSIFTPEPSPSASGSKSKPSQPKSEAASPQQTQSSTCRHSPRKRRSFSHSLPNNHRRSSTSTY